MDNKDQLTKVLVENDIFVKLSKCGNFFQNINDVESQKILLKIYDLFYFLIPLKFEEFFYFLKSENSDIFVCILCNSLMCDTNKGIQIQVYHL